MAPKMGPILSLCRSQAIEKRIGNAHPAHIISIYERLSAKIWNQANIFVARCAIFHFGFSVRCLRLYSTPIVTRATV
ncbi:hypothetical protein C8R32_11242 [Nitrosospira sp. Nsp5]|uniref:Uncharacterized protein n=1 Tax=Nitrosospira multiformis TaxID=1231 RepID=A0ABY0TDD0_9PROT|nr:hypothetical protein C8R32_11242 [Nitrosospira sp. Nsp5]SDQ65039.1 hypothetical protein SAMN05216402_1699 [Nitrosospira multiformis]